MNQVHEGAATVLLSLQVTPLEAPSKVCVCV